VEYDARRKLLWIKCAAPLGVPAPEGLAANEDGEEAAESRRREEEGWVAVREVQIEGTRTLTLSPRHRGVHAAIIFLQDARHRHPDTIATIIATII
jgi:hypothetical protein